MDRKWKTWNEEEKEFLEEKWGNTSLQALAKKLGRTEEGIIQKAKDIGLGSYYSEFIQFTGIANLLKIDFHCVKRWKDKGLIYKTNNNPEGLRYYVRMSNLVKFLKENQDLWDSRRLDKYSLGSEFNWLVKKRKMDNKLPRKRNQKWTIQEEKLLINYMADYTYKEIGNILGRSENGIQRKVDRLKDKKLIPKECLVPWSDKERQMLIDFDKQGVEDKDIAEEFGRDTLCISSQRRFMRQKGLYPKTIKQIVIIEQQKKKIMELQSKGMTYKQIGAEVGLHEQTICRRMRLYYKEATNG